jgi:hypothetical protein
MPEEVTPPESQPPAAPPAPPWGEDFDAEKAWNLIQNLRSDKEKLAQRPVLDDDARRKLAEYDRLEQASKTELERKTEEATRWQSEADRWRSASVKSTIQALAATDFADPSDAANALDPAKYLDSGGTIDEEAIRKDLGALLERKPHYRRSTDAPAPRVPAPNRAQGAGGSRASDPASEFAALLSGQLRR